jgi:hypothetical protein
MSLNIFELNQLETNFNQNVHFKSLSDSQRYYKYFVENENVIVAKYVNPILIAGKGYSEKLITTLDFLNCVLPIPIFSEKFVDKNGKELENELIFYPCNILNGNKTMNFFIARIIKFRDIFDIQHSGKRQLTDGTFIPDIPYYYKEQSDIFHIARDLTYKNRYVVSDKFKEICNDMKINFIQVTNWQDDG